MGMFDRIRCDVPLPDGAKGFELQTKDFDCTLDIYIITTDGRLLEDRGHAETVPLLERPMWNAEWGESAEAEADHPLEALVGSMRKRHDYQDMNYHGQFTFYGSDGRKVWHEYRAKFTDGELREIVLVPNG